MEQKLLTIALVSSAIGTGQKALAQTRGTTTDKPNVIIILADDLGYGDLECYGAKNVQTILISSHSQVYVLRMDMQSLQQVLPLAIRFLLVNMLGVEKVQM